MKAGTRVLVLGAAGMLGHKLVQRLGAQFATTATLREAAPDPAFAPVFRGVELIGGVAAERLETVARAMDQARPDWTVNCIGAIKQLAAGKDPVTAIRLNALLPHELARLCAERGARLLHFSTDCVFACRPGIKTEASPADADDLYGRSKLLGEVSERGCLTLRSSIVGRELRGGSGLIEWFLAQRGKRIKGFANALYSGLTTNQMAELVAGLIARREPLQGLWQVAGPAISKYDLLQLAKRVFGLEVEIERDEAFVCDRRLDGSRFAQATGFVAPDWPSMIATMRADPTVYGTH